MDKIKIKMKQQSPEKFTLQKVRELLSHVSLSIFGQNLFIRADEDKKHEDPKNGKRVFIQVFYHAPCTKNNSIEEWKGGKYYLSEYMTEDEIIKKAWVAFEAAVKHELMEGFKFDNIVVFNPHVNFRELLKISHLEVTRSDYFDV